MSAEFVAIAREFSKVLAAAAETLEKAEAAEERAKVADRRAHEAKLSIKKAHDELASAKAEHIAELQRLDGAHSAKLAAASEAAANTRAEYDTYTANAQKNVRFAGARLESLNKEVADLIKRRDELSAQVASLKATITDMAGNL